jgi:hypothetical protein
VTVFEYAIARAFAQGLGNAKTLAVLRSAVKHYEAREQGIVTPPPKKEKKPRQPERQRKARRKWTLQITPEEVAAGAAYERAEIEAAEREALRRRRLAQAGENLWLPL